MVSALHTHSHTHTHICGLPVFMSGRKCGIIAPALPTLLVLDLEASRVSRYRRLHVYVYGYALAFSKSWQALKLPSSDTRLYTHPTYTRYAAATLCNTRDYLYTRSRFNSRVRNTSLSLSLSREINQVFPGFEAPKRDPPSAIN